MEAVEKELSRLRAMAAKLAKKVLSMLEVEPNSARILLKSNSRRVCPRHDIAQVLLP